MRPGDNAVMVSLARVSEWKSGAECLLGRLKTCYRESDVGRGFFREKTGSPAPSIGILLAGLKACISARDLESGKKIHSAVSQGGHDSNIFVATSLVKLYAKCGSMGDARAAFDKMTDYDLVSMTTLMTGYVENGQNEVALKLFSSIQAKPLDARIYVAALKAVTGLAAEEEWKEVDGKFVKLDALEKGMEIHSQAVNSKCDSDIFLATTLVDMYAKCGSLQKARAVFDRISRPDVVCWNSLLLGYAVNGENEVVLELFAAMRSQGLAPDNLTFVAGFMACANLAQKEEGTQVDAKLVKASSLEKGMALRSQAAKCGLDSDMFVANTLVDMYAKCGSMAEAQAVFDKMLHPNIVSWTALMWGYVDNGEADIALNLYSRMRAHGSCVPDARTFVAALTACGSMVALETGKKIHSDILALKLESNEAVGIALVDFYAKCGNMIAAENIFQSAGRKSVVLWNALLTGYSRQGDTDKVFDLFQQMQRAENASPNSVTFLSVLTTCSHSGLVDKGREYFQAMESKYGIKPGMEHYHSVIDMLGRAGQLDEAVQILKSMPSRPNAVTWTILLGACRKWKNVEVGKLAFDSLLKLDERQAWTYLLMANIYGSVGMLEEQEQVLSMRVNAQAWKQPGRSWWTDDSGAVHSFMAGETYRHPQHEAIQEKLKDVTRRMKEQGYVADLSGVFGQRSDSEKEDALCGHSERLAIGCALVNTSPGTTIRIGKNLRVCGDCHSATAVLSKVEQREIICRDASRFHVFKDGACSCGNFW